MTDHGLNFKDFEIQALLREAKEAGTGKTQTRRALKPQPRGTPWFWEGDEVDPDPCWFDGWTEGRDRHGQPTHEVNKPLKGLRIQPGDRVWCRETWKLGLAEHRCAGYRADMHYQCGKPIPAGLHRWRPSIHMPRWASRLTLYVSEVRVQRLQDISEEDARSEGFTPDEGLRDVGIAPTAIGSFSRYWSKLHGISLPRNPVQWAANPWIYALTFRPVLGNIDTLPDNMMEDA